MPPKRVNKESEAAQLQAAVAELARRQQVTTTAVRAVAPTTAELAAADQLEKLMYPLQHAFFFPKSGARRRVLCGSRRIGKSFGAVIWALCKLLRNPKARVLYVSITAGMAREQFYPDLIDLVERYQLPFDFSETYGTLVHKRGQGFLLLRGADKADQVRKFRGLKLDGALLDESGHYGAEQESLVIASIGPTLRDNDGELLLTGTPGEHPSGLFYETQAGLRRNWERHHWTLLDNPYLRKEAKDLETIADEEGLARNSPYFIREYEGRYAIDTSASVFQFNPIINVSDAPLAPNYRVILGLDFGVTDANAAVALAFYPGSRKMVVLDSWAAPKKGVDDIALIVKDWQRKYPVLSIVGDKSGLGAATVFELWNRHRIHVETAEKKDKLQFIAFLNSAFTRGDLSIRPGLSIIEELPKVLWADDRKKIHSHAKDDQAHALLYAYRWAAQYVHPQKVVEDPWNDRPGVADPEKAARMAAAAAPDGSGDSDHAVLVAEIDTAQGFDIL